MIAIIDYDTGNLRSVKNALHRLGAEFTVTADHDVIRSAERVLLPGVGTASAAMRKLSERGLDRLIPSLRVPVLGICVGMQLMCRRSEEGAAECMGIFDTDVVKFRREAAPEFGLPADRDAAQRFGLSTERDAVQRSGLPTEAQYLKIPHMGWNKIEGLRTGLFDGVEEGAFVYYVHSYHAEMCPEAIALTNHGVDFCGALGRDNFFGTQFHPEKSGSTGERILHNFLTL